MSDKKISVVIPIYNGEEFIEKNLIILCRQTLEEIEYVLVNDASTDNTINILYAFKQAFPDKVVVVNSEKNRGPGGARNLGINFANGEYIGFMDCDDVVHSTMFEKLYKEAKLGDYDIVSCSIYDKENDKVLAPIKIKGILNDEKKYALATNILYVYNKIFKKSLLEKMSFHFREKTKWEDTDFTIEAILRAEKVSVVDECLYYYADNANSLSNAKKFSVEKAYTSRKEVFESIEKRGKMVGNYELTLKIKEVVVKKYLKNLLLYLFINPLFSLNDLKIFDSFAKTYLKEYYNVKYENANCFEDFVYNNLREDVAESYKNLISFRDEIESGKFDEKIKGK